MQKLHRNRFNRQDHFVADTFVGRLSSRALLTSFIMAALPMLVSQNAWAGCEYININPAPCLADSGEHVTLDQGASYPSTIYNENLGVDISNNGEINTSIYAIHNHSGTVNILENNGIISGYYGLLNEEAGIVTSISNTGTIYGIFGGIVNLSSQPGSPSVIHSIVNTGVITADLIFAFGIDNRENGVIDEIVNQSGGRIGDMAGAIKNAGTIYNVLNYGMMGSIENNGTIDSISNSGIVSITNDNLIRLIDNNATGTLSYLANRGQISGGISNEGIIDEITNYGTIGTANGLAIENLGTITNGINNYGLLDGRVELGGATLYLSGSSSRVTGEINGSPNSTVFIEGTFTQENIIDVDHIEVASGGQFTLNNSLNFAGDFINDGRVIINAGTTSSIQYGDYTQRGVNSSSPFMMNSAPSGPAWLEIGASGSGNGQYGKLYVGGTATFEPGAGIYVNVASLNTLANNAVLSSVVSSAHPIIASTFTMDDNSQLFNFEAILNGTSIDLITKLADGTGTGIFQATQNHGFSQGLGAAQVLDGFVNSSNSGDISKVVTALGKLQGDKSISDAVAQTLPLMSANLTRVGTDNMRTINHIIQARQEYYAGRSSGDEFLGDRRFWFKPLASRSDQDNRNGVAGYTADTYGMVFGADAEISERSRLGLAFSYMNSNVDGRSTANTNSADIDAYQLIGYGSHSLVSNPDIEINWQADIGINKNDGRRKINFGGLNRVAKSDFDSTTAHLGTGISRIIKLNERTSLIPSFRADYFWLRDDAYTEKGADALNLHVQRNTTDQLIAMAEGKVLQQLSDKAALSVSGGVGYDLLNNRDSITANYIGGGSAFRTQGMDLSPWIGRAGLGLTVNASERTEITARYDVEGRSDFVGQTASIKVRWAF